MTETTNALIDQVLALPEREREHIAAVIKSHSSETQEMMDQLFEDPEFAAEFDRRLKAIEDGTAKLWTKEEAFAELDRRRAEKRAKQST